MKGCKVCGRDFRSGRRVQVVSENNRLTGGIVCQRCADDGLTIVLKRPVAKEVKREVRSPQLDALKRRIEGFRELASLGPEDRASYRVEAYDQCLALIAAAQEGRPL